MDATMHTLDSDMERYIPHDNDQWNRCMETYGLSEHMMLKITLALGIDPDPETYNRGVNAQLGNDNEYWGRVYEFLHAHDMTSNESYEEWQDAPVDEFVSDPERRDLWMMLSLAHWQNERRSDDE